VSSSGLSIGTYNGILLISDPNAANSPQTVSIKLNITEESPPKIWTNTNNIDFSATTGGPNPSSKTLQIRNSGEGNLNYNVIWDASWVTVNPTSGTSSGGTNDHNVSVNISGLSEGNYYGSITISDPFASNNPKVVNLYLEIKAPIGNNRINISCSPNSEYPNQTVNALISINGNTSEIKAFGLNLSYDTNMFEFQGVSRGGLTGSWAFVDGNDNNGNITIGGIMGGGTPIPPGQQGTIVVAKFRVTGSSYSNGTQSQLRISNYADDISGMSPEPADTTFTLKK
jgi:hypothetical protein